MPKGDKYAPVRDEGIARLKTQSEQEDAPAWRDLGGADSQNISVLARPRQGIKMDPTDDAHMTTHRPPEGYDPDSTASNYAIQPGGKAKD